jgi:hypothetical protein
VGGVVHGTGRKCVVLDEVEFFDFNEDRDDVPPALLYDLWAEYLHANPFEWKIVYEGPKKGRADTVSWCMRGRGCLAVVRRGKDKYFRTLAAVWRFEE